jgi:hypothetical protein
MKCKVTKKQVKKNYSTVIGVGYCDAQYLIEYANRAFAYSAGVYGWQCDYYEFDNICISTGYDYIHGLDYEYSILRAYEKKAQKIALNGELDYDKKAKKLNALLKKFIAEVTK